MPRNILILQGHPDNSETHLCHALASAYAAGAKSAGHSVREIEIAALDLPLIRSQKQWLESAPSPEIKRAQDDILWSDHLTLFYPLWLGSMPGSVKIFFEQVFREDFVFVDGNPLKGKLKGRSARIVVTMGMPALVYRWYFGAHSLKSLERSCLKMAGFGPVRDTVLGLVDQARGDRSERWFALMKRLGSAAS